MSEARPQHPFWGARLVEAAAALTSRPTVSSVQDTVAVAWQATRLVRQPASPASELRWLRLVETLPAIWSDLAALTDSGSSSLTARPAPRVEVPEPADTAALQNAVARLIQAGAAALRGLAEATGPEDPDWGLRLALAGELLDEAVEDWP